MNQYPSNYLTDSNYKFINDMLIPEFKQSEQKYSFHENNEKEKIAHVFERTKMINFTINHESNYLRSRLQNQILSCHQSKTEGNVAGL